MKTTESEKLWSISIQDGRAKVFRNSIPLKSNHNGWEYGFLVGVTVKVQSAGDTFIQVRNNLRCLSFNLIEKAYLFKNVCLDLYCAIAAEYRTVTYGKVISSRFPNSSYVPSVLRQSVVSNSKPQVGNI